MSHTIFLSHATLSHTIFHTPLCHTPLCHTPSFTQLFHTPSFTHHFVKHNLSHTIFDTTSLTHSHRPSFTHHFSHTFLSHTTLSLTIFHQIIFHTHNFVTHHLSSTSAFVFLSFPVPAATFLANYWKKLTCGAFRSFFYVSHRRSIGAMHSWCRPAPCFHGPSHELCKVLRCFPFAFSGAWCFGFLSSCV